MMLGQDRQFRPGGMFSFVCMVSVNEIDYTCWVTPIQIQPHRNASGAERVSCRIVIRVIWDDRH